MLGYSADKALICGQMWSVSWCLSLGLGSMAMGSCCQHMESNLGIFLKNKKTALTNKKR